MLYRGAIKEELSPAASAPGEVCGPARVASPWGRCIFAALALLMLHHPLIAQESSDRREEDGDHAGGPMFDEREYEMGQRPAREMQERLERHGLDAAAIEREWRRSGAQAKRGAGRAGAPVWEFMGPMNQGGRIKGLAVARLDPSLWFCGADGGGIWRSTNGGSDWTPLTDSLPSLRIASLAMSPFDDRLVIGATHEGLFYRTDDGGESWRVITPSGNRFVNDLRFHPTDPSIVLAATQGGLLRSTDAGRSWTMFRRGGRVMNVSYNVTNPSTIFYSHNDEEGVGKIYRTTNSGETWRTVATWKTSYWGRINVRCAPSDPSIVYASVSDSSMFYRSTDGGESWLPLETHPVRDGYHRAFDIFDVSPRSSDLLIAGGTSTFRTVDGGKNWMAGDTINTDLHVDQHAFLFPPHLPGTFVVGNDGGVYRTDDYTADSIVWVRRDTNLATLQIYNCAMHPFSPDTIIVGCQDNGYDKFTGEKGEWRIVGGDGFCTIYDYESPRFFYHEYVHHNLHRADNGFTWWSAKKMKGLPTDTSDFYGGFAAPDRSDWYGQAIVISPDDPKRLYIGSNRLYRTVDRAENWESVSDVEYAANQNDYITAIGIAPGTGHTLYIGTGYGQIYRVIDGAKATTTDITPSFGALGRIRGFAVTPGDPMTIYACGDGGWDEKGVFRSTNGGESWVVASRGLPKGGVNRILIDPDDRATIYAGTVFGLFYTRDEGENWHRMPGFPNAEVWDFDFDEGSRTLLVGTYGRGAVRASGFEPPPAPVLTGVAEAPSPGRGLLEVRNMSGEISISVNLDRPERATVELFDYLGRRAAVLYNGTLSDGERLISVPTAAAGGLRPGAYVVTLRSESASARATMIITR